MTVFTAIHTAPGTHGPCHPPRNTAADIAANDTSSDRLLSAHSAYCAPDHSAVMPPPRSDPDARFIGPHEVMPSATITNNGSPSGWRTTFHRPAWSSTIARTFNEPACTATAISANIDRSSTENPIATYR